MLNADPFYKFMLHAICNDDIGSFDPDIFRFNAVNIISCLLTGLINDVMYKFTITSNINDHEMRLLINMKNEFLFKVFVTTEAKKNYIGLVELKEGKRPAKLKLDIKGLQIRKSSVNVHVRDELSDILEYDIMKADVISVPHILRKITNVETKIRESLYSGENKFCTPDKVKDPRAYAQPLQKAGVRGTLLWNLLYPEKKIELPNKVYTLKLDITRPQHFELLANEYPDVWEKLQILFGDTASGEAASYFKEKGITILALPLWNADLPEWTKHFIKYDKIITSSTSVMLPVLKSLSLTMGQSAGINTFSSVVQL